MAAARRIERAQTLIREVAAAVLARELALPEGVLVTVTRVAASDDLYYATVFVSVLGPDESAEAAALDELRQVTGLVQRALNRKLRMRPVPRITFAIDQDEKRRERIEKLLSEQQPAD